MGRNLPMAYESTYEELEQEIQDPKEGSVLGKDVDEKLKA